MVRSAQGNVRYVPIADNGLGQHDGWSLLLVFLVLDRCRRSIRMDKRRTGPQFHALGRDITAFHQRVVSLEYLKGRPVSLAPKAIIKHIPAAGGSVRGQQAKAREF